MIDLIFGISGIFVLCGFLWFQGRRHVQMITWRFEKDLKKAEADLLDTRSQLRAREDKLADIQSAYATEISRSAAFEERAQRIPELEKALDADRQTLEILRQKVTELTASLTYEREQAKEKMVFLEDAQEKLIHHFKALSAEALTTNNQSFLQLANSTFQKFQDVAKADLGHRQQTIGEMLTPVHQALVKVDSKIHELEKQRVGAYEGLRQQVHDLLVSQKELRGETANLVKALRTPQARGQWGEMQLKRVVEMAGMVAHCDFVEQTSVSTEQGRLRPDMIIHLPGGKKVIVDAKAPLAAYLEALESQDEAVKAEKMQDHARHVRNHIRQLSQRAYWDQFPSTPEFVVLFLPGETFFSAALEIDPSLIEAGVKEKVILATPTTLIALLRAVAYGWRQENIAENAKAISDLGQELYKRLGDMGSHLTRVGKNLGQAVEAYNQTVGTMERRVLVSARKFKELGSVGDVIEELPTLDHHPRALHSLELATDELVA